MRIFIFTLILLACGCIQGFSQSRNFTKAEELFSKTAYPAAIETYLKVVEEEPGNSLAVIHLADSYRLTDDFRSAFKWYAKAVKMKGVEGEVWYNYGEILMMNRKYQEAIPWFEKYQKKFPSDDRVSDMIASCQNQEAFAAGRSLYLLRRLNAVNSEASDFGPAFFGKAVVFASSRKRSLVKSHRTGDNFLDFYISTYAGKAELGEPVLFRGSLNTPAHEANASFSADGKEMFFTRNNRTTSSNGKEEIVLLSLYRAVYTEGKWQEAERLPFNDDSFSCGHPALSPDGKKLYFVSNMPGGFGSTDIYVVERNGETWGKPENLGQDINSKGNEMFPWVDSKGQLFFASNGRGGLGGLDVFEVDPNPDIVGNPVNLGAPINSSTDDFGFILDEKAGIAFFTSNRLGGKGDDDLYAAIRLISWQCLITGDDGAPLPDVHVDLREGTGREQTTTSEEGQFVLGLRPGSNYVLLLKHEGYIEQRLSFKGEDAPQRIEMKR